MKVKLKKPIEGKYGVYPADVWLEAVHSDGFLFVHHTEQHDKMKFKLVARSNVKEWKES